MTALIIENSSDARIVRDEIIAQIDSVIESVNDDLFQRLSSLRAEIVLDMNRRIASLPAIEEFTPIATTPALVLAYQIFGDSLRDTEIIARNGVENPNFVIGGESIELLI